MKANQGSVGRMMNRQVPLPQTGFELSTGHRFESVEIAHPSLESPAH